MKVGGVRTVLITAIGLAFAGSFIVLPAAPAAATKSIAEISIVVPITLPAHETGLVSAASLANLTSPFGLLNRELDQVIDKPVVLAIDPAILASIRVLGKGAPASAIAWLQKLDAATNETFALTYADSDISAQLQAGTTTVLGPESLNFAIDPTQIDDATLTLEGSPPLADAAQANSSDYTARLLAFDYSLQNVAWPTANSVTEGDLDSIAASGYSETIVSSDNVRLSDRTHASATVGSHSIVVCDDVLNGLFNNAVAAQSDAEWVPSKNSLLDGITSVLASSTSGSTSILLTLDRTLSASDADLGATIDAISALPFVQTVGLDVVSSQPGVSTSVVSKPQAERRVKSIEELLLAEKRDGSYSTIATNPMLISSQRRLDLLALLSNGWDKNPEGWAIARSSYLRASETLRSSVQVVQGGDITLLADRATLPITVSNSLNQAVTVFVVVRPLTPLIAVENPRVEMTIEPHSQRKGQIPVESLSNGTVKLRVSLVGANNAAIGNSASLRTTVQAGWETPVTISVGIVVVLIFAFGIYRNVVRRRRGRRGDG